LIGRHVKAEGANLCNGHLLLEHKFGDSYIGTVRALNAHFDGKFIVLDEPARLRVNSRVKVILMDADDKEHCIVGDFARLSENSFRAIWDNPLDADYDDL
jgi:hypothetical protein